MSKTYSAGIVTAYGSAVRAGYTGTYEDFCRQQAEYAQNALAVELAKDDAVSARNDAISAKDDAVTAKNTAVSAKDDAVSAKDTAVAKASEASTSATNASQSATSAGLSATSASQSAQNAEQSAQGISGSLAQIATNKADISQIKADLNYSNTTFGIGLIEGEYIDANGVVVSGQGRYISEFIPCPPNVPVTYVGENNHANICALSFYDEHFVFLGGDKNNGQPKGTPTTVTSPDRTRFCRLSTDEALVSAGTYYVSTGSLDKPFAWTNKRINNIEKAIESERKISIVEKPFEYPSEFDMTPKVTVYTDGHHYITDFNAKNFMNIGGRTLYVSPLATPAGNGTRENPYRYKMAYDAAQDGDTIVLTSGIYTRAGQYFTEIKKSINVIGEDGAVICLGDLTSFTPASGYQNVYVGQRTAGAYVFDITDAPNKVIPLTAVSSIAECAETVGSYFKDSSYYYVHPFVEGNPTGKLIINVLNTVEIPLSVSNADQSVNVYVGNITLIANPCGTRVNMVNSENTLTACYDNVNFVHCGYGEYNAFTAYGGNIVLHKCVIDGSYRDGFNYNGSSVGGVEPRICNAIEIDCKASNCGIGQTQETMNASTSHLGTKIVRINGEYHDTLGPVVADVQEGTKSVNLGCKSYSSIASLSNQNNAYQVNKDGAYMWLYDCIGVGNTIDFNATEGATMMLERCAYGSIADAVQSSNPEDTTTWVIRHSN